MIPAGSFDRRIQLLPPGVPEKDPETEQVQTREADPIPVWAGRLDRGGREQREGEAEVGVWTSRFRIRAEARVAAVNPRWRLRDEGQEFKIEAVGKVGREGLDLYCTLRV